jgi:Tfp pilus assembly protein PilN
MNTINLLPLKQNPCQIQIKQLRKIFSWGLLFALLSSLALYGFYQLNGYQIHKAISKTKAQQAQYQHEVAQAQKLISQIQKTQTQITDITTHKDETIQLAGFLSLLPQITPEGLYLVNLSWHEHTGILYGQADNNNTVVKFLNELKNNTYFESVNLIKSDMRHEQDGTLPIYFVINFHEYD